MKKYLFAAPLLAAISVQAETSASTLTLYGAVDLGVERASGGTGHVNRISSGLNTVSRFGVLGTEDLGGGWKARFRLESGINADDGSQNNATKFFGRWNFVGIGNRWGSVDMGRMWSPTFVVGLTSDPLARNRTSLGWNMFLMQSGPTTTAFTPGFTDNSVRYTSPRVNGFWGEAMVSFGEAGSAGNGSGNGRGFNLQYADGPAYLGYGYQTTDSGTAAAPVARPQASVSHFFGAKYRLGPVILYGTFNRNLSDVPLVPSSTNAMASVQWNVGGPHQLIGQLAKREVSGRDNDALGVQLGYNYVLSKRTLVYARYARVDNHGESAITLNGVALSGAGRAASFSAVGVSHTF